LESFGMRTLGTPLRLALVCIALAIPLGFLPTGTIAGQSPRSLCDAQPKGSSSDFCPARQLSVALPPPPSPETIGWIDEAVELKVDTTGRVSEVRVLEKVPGGSSVIAPALKNWVFRPAVNRGNAVNSSVLVEGMFRPAVTYNGPTVGTPPVLVAKPSPEIPFPTAKIPPGYPPLGVVEAAVVLVEVLVNPQGQVQNAVLVRPAQGLNREALDAARAWSFRPAQRDGRPVPAYAYLIFGFRRPLAS
jgi:TonB family protein